MSERGAISPERDEIVGEQGAHIDVTLSGGLGCSRGLPGCFYAVSGLFQVADRSFICIFHISRVALDGYPDVVSSELLVDTKGVTSC